MPRETVLLPAQLADGAKVGINPIEFAIDVCGDLNSAASESRYLRQGRRWCGALDFFGLFLSHLLSPCRPTRLSVFSVADGLRCFGEKSSNEVKALVVLVVAGLSFT